MALSSTVKTVTAGILALGAGLYLLLEPAAGTQPTQGGSVVLPALSPAALAGEQAFNENCVTCHGSDAAGTNAGPPLVNDIYNPGHHADASFRRAVENGVPRHHWPYGNMPAQPQVPRAEVEAIISYIRELQQANGIKYQEHKM